MSLVLMGFFASLGAGLLTAVRALPVLVYRNVSQKFNDVMLGFAAGVMLAASFFSLILPALEISTARYGAGLASAVGVTLGLLLGGFAVGFLNEVVPHEHFLKGREGPRTSEVDRVWRHLHRGADGRASIQNKGKR